MADDEKNTLDLTGKGIKKLEKRDGVGVKKFILDNNELSKLENLDYFQDVETLSACGNHLIRMFGVSKLPHLVFLSLSNNNIVCIEGIKELSYLTWLNLSGNSIKSIQNVQHCSNLTYIDLSKNNIASLVDISHLSKLKTFHLNGNQISTLHHASNYFPASLSVLSLADNCITDLNEVSYLCGLHCLEQLTIANNPCILMTGHLPGFDYRPFIINWCLGLRLLDGYVVSQKESLKAEWLYSQGRGRHFKPGEHAELAEYLSQVCPLTSDQLVGEEDERLTRILQMQRQHREQLLHELSQSPVLSRRNMEGAVQKSQQNSLRDGDYDEKSKRRERNLLSPKYSKQSSETDDATDNCHTFRSEVSYIPVPQIFLHTRDSASSAAPSICTNNRSVSAQPEITHVSIRSPGTVDKVVLEADISKIRSKSPSKTPYQYYEDRAIRPSQNRDMNIFARAELSIQNKNTPIRKVSKRVTSPSSLSPSTSRSRTSKSPNFKSRVSPSKSNSTQEKYQSKLPQGLHSSESDTSEEHVQSLKMSGRKTPSPFHQYKQASPSITPKHNLSFAKEKCKHDESSHKISETFSHVNNFSYVDSNITHSTKNIHRRPQDTSASKLQALIEKYNRELDELEKAAVKIQSLWRGYYVRHHKVHSLRQEVRLRRMEDHIRHLHGHLFRLTNFVLRQQQDLQREKEYRRIQTEDITRLSSQVKELQVKVNDMQKEKERTGENTLESSPQSESAQQPLLSHSGTEVETFSEEESNERLISNKKKTVHRNGTSKAPQNPKADFMTSALSHSTQSFQENSGLHSPSSQTSSVVSSLPDSTLQETRLCNDAPQTSDTSDADSGMQSISSSFSIPQDNDKTPADNATLYSNGALKNAAITSLVAFQQPLENSSVSSTSELLIGSKNIHESRSNSVPICTRNQTNIPKNSSSSAHSSDAGSEFTSPQDNDALNNKPCVTGNETLLHSKLKIYSTKDRDIPLVIPATRAATIATMPSITSQHNEENSRQPFHHISSSHSETPLPGMLPEKSQCNTVNHTSFQEDNNPKVAKTKSGNLYSKERLLLQGIKAIELQSKNCFPSSSTYKSNNSTRSKPSTPLENREPLESPRSPCTVQMSGRISHSCSFQSGGFTAAEEVSTTATVKVVSTRAVSMEVSNGPLSPQDLPQKSLPTTESSPPQMVRTPLALATAVWDKRVQQIQSTFQQLQSQINDLEGTFGQFFIPAMVPEAIEESSEGQHVMKQIEGTGGALALELSGINLCHSGNKTTDNLILETQFDELESSIPLMAPHCTLSEEQTSPEQLQQVLLPNSSSSSEYQGHLANNERQNTHSELSNIESKKI